MSDVIRLGRDIATTAYARVTAAELREGLETLLAQTERTIVGAEKARSIEVLLKRFAGWLSRYHVRNIRLTFTVYTTGDLFNHQRHVQAIETIGASIAAIETSVAYSGHWIAYPNLDRMRWNIQSVLGRIIVAIRQALAACDVLEGHQGRAA